MKENPKKFIDFIITQKCTYNCIYCSQSKAETKNKENAKNKTINSFLKILKTLENDWEITITGGEAILHPDFFYLIKEVKKQNFKINLITNLSFNIKIYQKIFNILDNSLNRYDISFHLDEIKNFDETLKKAELFLKSKPYETKTTFLIPIFKINKHKEKQIEKIINLAKKYQINYDYQQIRYLNNFIKQTSKEKKYFQNIKPVKTYSKLCNAGKTSFIIYEDGEAYRCYSSRFLKSNSMGNINNKNFKLIKKATPCAMKYCNCPKPIIYNQIKENKKPIQAIVQNLKNLLFLPYLIVKNKNIIKIKLKQKIT